jgi:hypothetical protein
MRPLGCLPLRGRKGVTLLTPVRDYVNNGEKGFQQSLFPDFTPLRSPEISRVPGFLELERYIIFFYTRQVCSCDHLIIMLPSINTESASPCRKHPFSDSYGREQPAS